MLYKAACHQASLHDLPYPVEYENLVIRDIIANVELLTVGTILATNPLANVKRRSGKSSPMHWRAAQTMIANNGGLLLFRFEPLVFTKLTWTAIALPGTSYGFPDEPADGKGYEELKRLLSQRRSRTLKALPTSQDHAERQNDYFRAKVFKTRTQLKRLLQCASESIQNEKEAPSIKGSCRIAILPFLTSAMQDYGDFSLAVELYLAAVEEHLNQKTDDSALCSEHLIWSLIRLSFLYTVNDNCIEFWMTVVRMTTAWKRLEMADRQAIEASLWASLELPETMYSLTTLGPPKMTPVSIPWQMCEQPVPKDCFCELLWFTVPI